MRKKEIEFKLKCIESEEEMVKETAKWSKETYRLLLFMGIVLTIFILITTGNKGNINVLDVFSIALLVSNIHQLIRDMISHKHKDNHKLMMLDLDRRFYTAKLKMLEEEENERE